jgi:hypothetical protein
MQAPFITKKVEARLHQFELGLSHNRWSNISSDNRPIWLWGYNQHQRHADRKMDAVRPE